MLFGMAIDKIANVKAADIIRSEYVGYTGNVPTGAMFYTYCGAARTPIIHVIGDNGTDYAVTITMVNTAPMTSTVAGGPMTVDGIEWLAGATNIANASQALKNLLFKYIPSSLNNIMAILTFVPLNTSAQADVNSYITWLGKFVIPRGTTLSLNAGTANSCYILTQVTSGF